MTDLFRLTIPFDYTPLPHHYEWKAPGLAIGARFDACLQGEGYITQVKIMELRFEAYGSVLDV